MLQVCFECGTQAEYKHHVVPQSRGGTKTIPLCGSCHGKAHFRDKRMSSGELTAAAMRVKQTRGELISRVPFGFDLGDDGKTLTPNQAEQEALSLLRELRASGLSYRKIGAELTRRGIPTKNGGPWQATTIRNFCEVRQ